MPAGEVIRLYNRQHFMGLGEITANQEIMAKRLLSNSYWSEMAL
ncbi:tRNA pseudouridine(55) synthase TruB [Nitrosomonas sp.]